jgi:hypothetical protein
MISCRSESAEISDGVCIVRHGATWLAGRGESCHRATHAWHGMAWHGRGVHLPSWYRGDPKGVAGARCVCLSRPSGGCLLAPPVSRQA